MLKKSLKQYLLTQQSILSFLAQGRDVEDCLLRIFTDMEAAARPLNTQISLLVREPGRTVLCAPTLNALQQEPLLALSDALKQIDFDECLVISDLAQPSGVVPVVVQKELHLQGWHSLWLEPVRNNLGQSQGLLIMQARQTYYPDKKAYSAMAAYINVLSSVLEKHSKDLEIKMLNDQLSTSLSRLQVFHQVQPDIGLVISEEGVCVDAFGEQVLPGFTFASDYLNQSIKEFLPEEVSKKVEGVIQHAFSSGQTQIVEFEFELNGEIKIFEGRIAEIDGYGVLEPKLKHVIWMARDITQRKLSEKRIEELAFYDPLTHLPNRNLLMDRLQHTIDQVKRQKTIGALIFVDLDGFKDVNDQFGHDYGDELLTLVAQRMNDCLRDSDTVARYGGDEFVIVLERFDDNLESMHSEVMNVSKRVLDSLKPGMIVRDQPFLINASVGVSFIYGENAQANTVLKEADNAMYQAKNTGKGQICLYKAG